MFAVMRRDRAGGSRRQSVRGLVLLLCALGLLVAAQGAQGDATARKQTSAERASDTHAYNIARRYLIRFYPLWFTHTQRRLIGTNRIAGPVRMSPIWGIVVAPNDDTIYSSALLDLSDGPLILTVPDTTANYSVLQLDVFGNILKTAVEDNAPGVYGLVGPDWEGTLPDGVKKVRLPVDSSEFIIRADKYTGGVDTTAAATEFRRNLHLASLEEYRQDPTSGRALIVPEYFTAPRVKVMADEGIEAEPTKFLKTTQKAVHSPATDPLTRSDRRLSDKFDRVFGHATGRQRSRIILGAQVGHDQLVDRWLSHTGPNNWIHFDNIGQWGTKYLDRAALTEYIQFGNGPETAGYYNVFVDRKGVPLDASVYPAYILTFPASKVPDAKRFWSLTAYLPESVTLVPNEAEKYLVASYTPGLVTNPDGSISIYIQPERPIGVPEANWLPVPRGPFNLLLRVYGPTGNAAPGTGYEPPPIRATFPH